MRRRRRGLGAVWAGIALCAAACGAPGADEPRANERSAGGSAAGQQEERSGAAGVEQDVPKCTLTLKVWQKDAYLTDPRPPRSSRVLPPHTTTQLLAAADCNIRPPVLDARSNSNHGTPVDPPGKLSCMAQIEARVPVARAQAILDEYTSNCSCDAPADRGGTTFLSLDDTLPPSLLGNVAQSLGAAIADPDQVACTVAADRGALQTSLTAVVNAMAAMPPDRAAQIAAAADFASRLASSSCAPTAGWPALITRLGAAVGASYHVCNNDANVQIDWFNGLARNPEATCEALRAARCRGPTMYLAPMGAACR